MTGGKKILRRKRAIAIESEQAAVILVGSLSRRDHHLRAAPPELGRAAIGNELEFADRLERRRQRGKTLVAGVDIRYAIYRHIGGTKPRAAGDHRILSALLHTGSEREQVENVRSAVEWHALDLHRIHDRADR